MSTQKKVNTPVKGQPQADLEKPTGNAAGMGRRQEDSRKGGSTTKDQAPANRPKDQRDDGKKLDKDTNKTNR